MGRPVAGVGRVVESFLIISKASDADLIAASVQTGESLDALNLARLVCQRAGQSYRAAGYLRGPRKSNPE